MATYKTKYSQFIVNSSKQLPYTIHDDIIVLNLNASITKKVNLSKLINILGTALETSNKVNLCNYASLLFKLELNYNSDASLDLIEDIVNCIKEEFDDIELMQNNMENCGEIDCQPISTMVSFDSENNIIYANSIITDSLKKLGYVDNQLYSVIDYSIDLREIFPTDILLTLPVATEKNKQQYTKIKDIILGDN